MISEQLDKIREEALKQIKGSDGLEKLNEIRVNFLGKKGELTSILKSMKDVAPEDRPKVGQLVNETREAIEKVLEETGICFLFAQTYHSAMKYVGPVRKQLAIRTVFNILGPLTNPANAEMQVMGVYSEELVEPMAKILHKLGLKKAMVVYGEDGLDEISASAKTKVCEMIDGSFTTYEIDPEDYGFALCDKTELVGGTPQENAEITRGILNGTITDGKRTAVLLNSAAGLHLALDIPYCEAIDMAAKLIDSGKAQAKLDEFIRATTADNRASA